MMSQKTPVFPKNTGCPDIHIGSGEHNAVIENGEEKRQ
jgi:hypothetical protein